MAKLMIALPDDFVKRVDRAARADPRGEPFPGRPPPTPGRLEARLAALRALEHLWVGQRDSTEVSRYFRERL